MQDWITHFVGSMGNTGVDIFFVISGFLMYGIVMPSRVRCSKYLGNVRVGSTPCFCSCS